MPSLRALWKVRKYTFKWESVNKSFGDRILYGLVWLMGLLITPIFVGFAYLLTYGLCFLIFAVSGLVPGEAVNMFFAYGANALPVVVLFFLVAYIPVAIKDMMEEWDYSRPYLQKLALWSFYYKFRNRFKRLGFIVEPDFGDAKNRFKITGSDGEKKKILFIQPMTVSVLGPEPRITITSFNGKTAEYKYTPYNAFTKLRWLLLRKWVSIKLLGLKHKVNTSQYGELALRGASFKQLDALLTLDVSAPMSVRFMELDIPVSEYENLKDLPLEWVSKAVS